MYKSLNGLHLQIKKFVRNCPVPAYTSKMKTLVQKLEEHSNLVKKKRAADNLDLHDASALVISSLSLFVVEFCSGNFLNT